MIDGAKFFAAASLLVLILGSHGQYPVAQEQPGVERWAVKTSLIKGQMATVIPLDSLGPPRALLPSFVTAGVAKNDPRYQKERLPCSPQLNFCEGQLVRTEGWLHLVALENDGDYHVQLSQSKASQVRCFIVEVPKPDPRFVADTTLHPVFRQVRDFIKTKLLKEKEPTRAGSLLTRPVYVEVEGALFYDDAHVSDPPRGKRGCRSPTLWEIHPVTGIKFAVP